MNENGMSEQALPAMDAGVERQTMDVDIVCVGFGPAMGGFLTTLARGLTNSDGTPAVESRTMPGIAPAGPLLRAGRRHRLRRFRRGHPRARHPDELSRPGSLADPAGRARCARNRRVSAGPHRRPPPLPHPPTGGPLHPGLPRTAALRARGLAAPLRSSVPAEGRRPALIHRSVQPMGRSPGHGHWGRPDLARDAGGQTPVGGRACRRRAAHRPGHGSSRAPGSGLPAGDGHPCGAHRDRRWAGRCGQSLLPPNEYFFGNLFHYNRRDGRFCFPNVGLSFPYNGAIKELYDWHLVSPAGNTIHFGYPDNYAPPFPGMVKAPIALVYDKETMVQDLLSEAKQHNVEVFPNTEFTDITWAGPEVITVAGGKQFRSSFVIAADGTNSRMVQKLGYNHDRRHIANLYVKSFYVDGFKSPDGKERILTGVGFVDDKPVYIFCLPRPEGPAWNALFLTFEGDLDIGAAADRLMQDSQFAECFRNTKRVREFAAMEYISSPVINPFKNNVLSATCPH